MILSLWLTQESHGPVVRFRGPALLVRAALGLTVGWWLQFGVLSISGVNRRTGMAEALDLLFLASLACFALAAAWPREPGRPALPPGRARGALILSFLPALGAMGYGSWVLLLGRSLDAVMVGAGVVLGLTLCLRQYLAVQDLEALSRELEARVEARTRELRARQEALLEAQRVQVVAGMAAGFAHDFKNALTVIDTWCDLLLTGPQEEWSRGLEAIRQASAKALGSVRKVLSAGRQQELHPQDLDLARVLPGFQGVLEGVLRGRARLRLDLPPQLPARIDPAQLEDILLNLVGNAGDAMVTVGTVTLRAFQDPAEPLAVLQVVDTGSGIPPEVMAHLFEPFTTTKPAGQGSGLGLASVKGVVWQSGGSVSVESAPGVGTTFTLKLPQPSGA